jgi:hypothetical protein
MVNIPSSVEVLDTLKPVRLAPTAVPRSSCLARSPSEWQMYTIHVLIVSRLKHSLTRLLPFIYTDLKWIYQVTSIRDHSVYLDSPGQFVMERGAAPNVLYTVYICYIFVL